MNLTQELQKTPKWKKFEEWYNKYLTTLSTCTVGDKVHLDDINKDNLNDLHGGCEYAVNFCFLPLDLQKGVFEKFIAENSKKTIDVTGTLRDEHYAIYLGYGDYDSLGSFEDLLIRHFNQE